MSLLQRKKTTKKTTAKKVRSSSRSINKANEIVEALLGPVLVDKPVDFPSDGAVERHQAVSIWKWLVRDIDAELEREAISAISEQSSMQDCMVLSCKVANLIADSMSKAQANPEVGRRIQIQVGGEAAYEQLPQMETAFRHQKLLPKAVAFGQAINAVSDENSLKLALQTFPVEDSKVSALMMHAALGQVTNPHRLISVVLDLSDGKNQKAITRAGYAPVVDALISHAQNQISFFVSARTQFTDVDLNCRALERYHRLMRAVTSITENDKSSAWAHRVATLVRRMSEIIEPKLLSISTDIRQSLRKSRTGADRVNSDQLLDALNGLYLLAAAREALDTLALNSLVNKLWIDVGKELEMLIGRNLDWFRQSPDDDIVAQRLNTGIKMAEIRFNPEYARIISRARDGAARRTES